MSENTNPKPSLPEVLDAFNSGISYLIRLMHSGCESINAEGMRFHAGPEGPPVLIINHLSIVRKSSPPPQPEPFAPSAKLTICNGKGAGLCECLACQMEAARIY